VESSAICKDGGSRGRSSWLGRPRLDKIDFGSVITGMSCPSDKKRKLSFRVLVSLSIKFCSVISSDRSGFQLVAWPSKRVGFASEMERGSLGSITQVSVHVPI
jgi:hypothetical protein